MAVLSALTVAPFSRWSQWHRHRSLRIILMTNLSEKVRWHAATVTASCNRQLLCALHTHRRTGKGFGRALGFLSLAAPRRGRFPCGIGSLKRYVEARRNSNAPYSLQRNATLSVSLARGNRGDLLHPCLLGLSFFLTSHVTSRFCVDGLLRRICSGG